MQIRTENSEDCEKVGQALGNNLKGGEFIELVSDVGGGKTTLTRGLAKGAGSSDHVASPTFTISHIYKTPNFEIHHFDFYRLHEAGLIQHELQDVINDPQCVVVVEWSDIVTHVLPEQRIKLHIKTVGENQREIYIFCPEELQYVLGDIS